MAYKIKKKSKSQLMMEKNNRLMLKIDRDRERRRRENEAKKIINSDAFKRLKKAGFSERKSFKIIRGY